MSEFAGLALDELVGEITVAEDSDEEPEIGEADRALGGRGRDRAGFERLLMSGREARDSFRGLSERDAGVW